MQNVDVLFVRSSIQLTPGRHKLAASQMSALMTDAERKLFGDAVRASIEAADHAEALSAARRDRAKNVYGDEAQMADAAVDAVASLVASTLAGYGRIYESGTEGGDAARRLEARFFPRSLKDIVQAPYAEELIKLERVLAATSEAEVARDIARVPGLTPLMEELGARTAAYRVALDRAAASGVSYAEAREAVLASERRQLELLAMVFGHFRGDAPETVKRRSELVEPYVVLMQNLRDRFRRRQSAGELDGETGELIEGIDDFEGELTEGTSADFDTTPGVTRRKPEPVD